MAATHNSKTTTRTVVLYLAFELGETEWKLALTIGGVVERSRQLEARREVVPYGLMGST